MTKLIVFLAAFLTYALIATLLSQLLLGQPNPFWAVCGGTAMAMLTGIVTNILHEEGLNLRQLRQAIAQVQRLKLPKKNLWVVGVFSILIAALIVLGILLEFVDFRNVGDLNGFSKDARSITYVIDNSGSMGCADKSDLVLENGYCSQTGDYQVELAKNWVRKDVKSLDRVEQVRILEVGGLTTEGEKEQCKIKKNDIEDTSVSTLDKTLGAVKANSSGATNISGAILQAADGFSGSEDEGHQVIIITDLGQNCGTLEIEDIESALIKKGWSKKNIEPAMKSTAVFSLSSVSRDQRATTVLRSKGRLSATSPVGSIPDSLTTKRQEIQALRQQGIRVIELENFDQLDRLSIPGNFNLTFLLFFFTSLMMYGLIQMLSVIIYQRKNSRKHTSSALVLRNLKQRRVSQKKPPGRASQKSLPSSQRDRESR